MLPRTAYWKELVEIPDGKTDTVSMRKKRGTRFAKSEDDAILKFFASEYFGLCFPVLFFLFNVLKEKIFHGHFIAGRSMYFTQLFEELHFRK